MPSECLVSQRIVFAPLWKSPLTGWNLYCGLTALNTCNPRLWTCPGTSTIYWTSRSSFLPLSVLLSFWFVRFVSVFGQRASGAVDALETSRKRHDHFPLRFQFLWETFTRSWIWWLESGYVSRGSFLVLVIESLSYKCDICFSGFPTVIPSLFTTKGIFLQKGGPKNCSPLKFRALSVPPLDFGGRGIRGQAWWWFNSQT